MLLQELILCSVSLRFDSKCKIQELVLHLNTDSFLSVMGMSNLFDFDFK